MKKIIPLLVTSIFLLTLCGPILAQKPAPVPSYKIAAINVTPFNEAAGKFNDPLGVNERGSFFNDMSISLFVTVEISGQIGSFEVGRKLQVTVMEGKKVKYSKIEQVGLIGEGGRYYMPVYLYSSMCSNVTITAKLIGQKTASSMKRTVEFMCGE